MKGKMSVSYVEPRISFFLPTSSRLHKFGKCKIAEGAYVATWSDLEASEVCSVFRGAEAH
jgi:hypothetical protein